jgi:hypothetical protein
LTFTCLPRRAVVHRDRSGQFWQRAPKLADPVRLMGTVTPLGQVTVPTVVSIVKSSIVNPPGILAVSGIGLITAV